MTFGFFLCGEKGLRVLEAVTQIPGLEIEFVMAARDPGLTGDHFDAIEQQCQLKHIPFHERGERMKVSRHVTAIHKEVNMPEADHSFAVGWKWMIRDRPNLIVLHDSLLPRYRGNCPVVQALINKEPFVGVSAFVANEEMDGGPLFYSWPLEITYPAKIADVMERVAHAAVGIAINTVTGIMNGHPPAPFQQREENATYSLWRDDQDYRIDWKRSAKWIKRFIDAVGPPYTGAFTMRVAMLIPCRPLIRIFDAEVVPNLEIEDRESHIGKVFRVQDGCPVIVCGEGLLKLTQVSDAPKSWYRQRLV